MTQITIKRIRHALRLSRRFYVGLALGFTIFLLGSTSTFASVDGNWSGTPRYTNSNGESTQCSDFGASITVDPDELRIHQSAECGAEWDLSVTMRIVDGVLFQGDRHIGTISETQIEFSNYAVTGGASFVYSASIKLVRDRTISFSDKALWENGYSEKVVGSLESAGTF